MTQTDITTTDSTADVIDVLDRHHQWRSPMPLG